MLICKPLLPTYTNPTPYCYHYYYTGQVPLDMADSLLTKVLEVSTLPGPINPAWEMGFICYLLPMFWVLFIIFSSYCGYYLIIFSIVNIYC